MEDEMPGFGADYKALDAFFAPLASRLEEFAERYNLRLLKYQQYNPSWDFLFRHPSGGVASIQVLKDGADHLHLAASWAIDDFKTYERKLWFAPIQRMARTDEDLRRKMEGLLRTVIQLSPSALRPASSKYPNWKGKERELEEAVSWNPLPRFPE